MLVVEVAAVAVAAVVEVSVVYRAHPKRAPTPVDVALVDPAPVAAAVVGVAVFAAM